LIFYNKLKKDIIEYINKNTNYNQVNTFLLNFIETNLDCIICYCSLLEKKFNSSIVECDTCHNYCFNTYKSKNYLLSNNCIYSKTGNIL
jgi:hypothetical protein